MATMRPLLRRIELRWIGFLLVGALCGALVMFGVDALRQSNHDANAPIVTAPVVAPNSAPIAGRSNDGSNADTARSWYLLHEYNPPALPATVAPGERGVSAPTVRPQQIVGPGEGVHVVAPDSSTNDSIPPIIDTTGGLNPKR